jgi:hypothetical protein
MWVILKTIQETVDNGSSIVRSRSFVMGLASICHDSAQSSWNASRNGVVKETEAMGLANNDINYKDSMELTTINF